MPHGTIAEYALRSQSQFRAKPCGAVLRATRMPIAAILRCGLTPEAASQTPDRPSTPGSQPELRANPDQRFLKAPNIIHHIHRLGQPYHRIPDQLSGPCQVICRPGRYRQRASCRPGVRGFRWCACRRTPRGARAATCPVGDPGIGQFALHPPGVQIVDRVEIAHRHRRGTGSDGRDPRSQFGDWRPSRSQCPPIVLWWNERAFSKRRGAGPSASSANSPTSARARIRHPPSAWVGQCAAAEASW